MGNDEYTNYTGRTIAVYTGYYNDGTEWTGQAGQYWSDDDTEPESMSEFGMIFNDEFRPILEDGQRIRIDAVDSATGQIISTGYEFFSTYKFKQALAGGIVHFIYKKVNGRFRDAYGTTNTAVLRQNHVQTVFSGKRRNTKNIRYYDMRAQGWRSFRPDSLTQIYEPVDMDNYN